MALLAEQHTESVLINTDNLALRPWRAKEVHDLYAANDLSTQHAAGPSHSYLPAGSGQRVWMSGDEYLILLDAAHSAGTMTLLDAHADVDELFVVLDGEFEIMADGKKYQVEPGGRVFVKRHTMHAF